MHVGMDSYSLHPFFLLFLRQICLTAPAPPKNPHLVSCCVCIRCCLINPGRLPASLMAFRLFFLPSFVFVSVRNELICMTLSTSCIKYLITNVNPPQNYRPLLLSSRWGIMMVVYMQTCSAFVLRFSVSFQGKCVISFNLM